MASTSGDVDAVLLELGVEVEKPDNSGTRVDGGSNVAAAVSRSSTTTEESGGSAAVRHDNTNTGPEPCHRDESAAAAVEATARQPEQEKLPLVAKEEGAPDEDEMENTRERLKRHRREMAGRVWVPEMWGQEKLLKDWVDIDCAIFDRSLVPTGLLAARRALVAECCTRRRPDRTSTAAAPARYGCGTAAPDDPSTSVRSHCH